jgi:OOP family OmpA-OmpF porin
MLAAPGAFGHRSCRLHTYKAAQAHAEESFMKMLSAMFALVLALSAGVASADHHTGTTSPFTAPVCGAGPTGDHPTGIDADGDGVVDSEDWCPHSNGDRVGPNGCAVWDIAVDCSRMAAAPAPMRVVPLAAAPVNPMGTRDADHDGVADEDDRCPGTPRGVEVDKNGCANISKVVLKGVNFATGSAKLLPAASETLRTVASAMKADSKIRVEVSGHTDSVGEEAKNQGLSERRAKSVKDFLVSEGIDSGRLSTKGYGESKPVDTNDTAAGRANNRRVTFKVL